MSYSLNSLDIKMEQYLNHIKNGFFIEVGAHDGIMQSNTKYYENKGWTGLLIEPNPETFEMCKQNRPNSIVENYCLVSDLSIKEITLYEAGLMTIAQNSITHHGDAKSHIAKANTSIKELKCQATTLQFLLDKHNISNIDFFSLDVEGYEYEVLKGIDFNKIKIGNILLECNVEKQYNKIFTLLTTNGFYMKEKLSQHDFLFISK